jgi:hypothetical protein
MTNEFNPSPGAPPSVEPAPRAKGYSPSFSPEAYKKRSYVDMTGMEATYPKPASEWLRILDGLTFKDDAVGE